MGQDVFLIYARAANGTIGQGGAMPWHIPADLRHFKALTMGGDGAGLPMVMGRKTFDSLPGRLAGRRHIVLTRDRHWQADGAQVVHSLDEALAAAGDGDVAVIGGAEIFALFMPMASRIELTEVHRDYEGDAHVPPAGPEWREIAREEYAAKDGRPAFAFVTLVRDL